MAKILIADDEELIRKLISDCLVKDGHTVFQANNGLDALNIFKKNRDISLCLLDIMMPEYDGWEVCRKIREISGVPIMLVSARSQDFDQILGFENGADEYVTKPFSLSDLSEKINSLLKRGAVQTPTGLKDTGKFEFNGLVLNTRSHEAFLNNREIDLTKKEFEILKMLFIADGNILNRIKLVNEIWGEDFLGDERTIDSHIVRLRAKLGNWGTENILTVYGLGYKLNV